MWQKDRFARDWNGSLAPFWLYAPESSATRTELGAGPQFSGPPGPDNGRRRVAGDPPSAHEDDARCISLLVKPSIVRTLRAILCTREARIYLDFSFIAFTLALTSFLTKVNGRGLPIGKLTIDFVAE